MKALLSLSSATLVCATLLAGAFSPASAAGCYYKAVNPQGKLIGIRGVGHAAKKSWACNRARKKCNNRLERALKKGEFRTDTSRGYQCKRSG